MSGERAIVLLSCGHWFREARDPVSDPPENGEIRICSQHGYSQARFRAVYLEHPPSLAALGDGWDVPL